MRTRCVKGLSLVALLGGLSAQAMGCGDDESGDEGVDGNQTPIGLDGSTGGETAMDGIDASLGEDAGAGSDASTGQGSSIPTLPKLLSLSGCEDLDIPALCSVTQTEGTFAANCAGAKYTGSVQADRSVELKAPETTDKSGAKINVSCSGRLDATGKLALDCQRTSSAAPAADAGMAQATTCKLSSDPQILPGIECMELPAQLDDVAVCKEGASQGGTTINGGTCKVVQDGCSFQAECANDVTISGTATKTGVRFTQPLKALADAVTPASGTPAFLKGAEANHTCTGTIADGKLTGSCTAGGSRGTMPTSVCALEGAGTLPQTCGLVAPAAEQLFVLNACDILKSGEGAAPGIGEPICAFRQNGCTWDLQCGSDPNLKFAGRLTPGAAKVAWQLATGTPCELSIDSTGAVMGKCTVQGQAPCQLASKPATPGGASCTVLPGGTNVKSHGCGGGDPLKCRATLQHQCSYMGLCEFTANNPSVVIAGETSIKAGRPSFSFNGIGDFKCSVDKATEAEIASGDRSPYEWYGQCVTPAGGMCRDNYDPAAKTGFRGLRLYFDVPAGTTVPPTATAAP